MICTVMNWQSWVRTPTGSNAAFIVLSSKSYLNKKKTLLLSDCPNCLHHMCNLFNMGAREKYNINLCHHRYDCVLNNRIIEAT